MYKQTGQQLFFLLHQKRIVAIVEKKWFFFPEIKKKLTCFILCETVNYRTRRVTKSLRQNCLSSSFKLHCSSIFVLFCLLKIKIIHLRALVVAIRGAAISLTTSIRSGENLLLTFTVKILYVIGSGPGLRHGEKERKDRDKNCRQKSGRKVFFFLLSMHLCIITNISRAIVHEKSNRRNYTKILLFFFFFIFLN